MKSLKKLFSILTPADYATKQLAAAEQLLLDTQLAREDAQAKAARMSQDILMLERRIKRLNKMNAPASDVVSIRRSKVAA